MISDSSGYEISSYTGTVTTGTTTPATVTAMSLGQTTQANSASATYDILYTTMNQMSSGSTFLINYPSTVSVSSTLSTCYVTYNSVVYTMTCSVYTGSQTIKVYNGLTTTVPKGSSVYIYFGPVTNPSSSTATSSFTMTSYTDSTFTYTIDTIPSGLVPGLSCNNPCLTCLSTNKTHVLHAILLLLYCIYMAQHV
jgi:hypothetical protein